MPRTNRQKQGNYTHRRVNKRESRISKAVFVRNFNEDVTEKQLVDFFNKIGKVSKVLLVRDCKTRRSCQKAFVYFCNMEDAQKVVARKGCPELNFNGQQLYVEAGKSKHVKAFDGTTIDQMVEGSESDSEAERRKALTVNDLPSEILAHIFNFLEMKERIRIETVCKRWHAIAITIPWRIDSLLKDHLPKDVITDKIFNAVLKRCGWSLQRLDMEEFHHNLTSQALKSIAQYCPNLTSITFKDVDVTNTKLKAVFTTCTQIKHLAIINNVFVENNLKKVLPMCKNLESLSIQHNTVIEGQCFSLLSKKLKTLSLKNCFKLTPKGFQQLQACTGLEELTLDTCSNLDHLVLNFICDHFSTTLRKLELNGQFNDVNYIQVPFDKLVKLEELSIAFTEKLTDGSLKEILKKCPKLWKLDISRTQVSALTLQLLTLHPKITDINISHFVEDANDELMRLAILGKLEALTIRGCTWLADATCLALTEHCKNLRYLDVSSCFEISDDMIGAVQLQERPVKLTIIAGGTMVNNFIASPKLVVKNVDLCPYYWRDIYSDDESDDDPDYVWSFDDDSDFCYEDIEYYYSSDDDEINPYGNLFLDPGLFFNEG